MDKFTDDARLIHYTALDTQPWHPVPDKKYKPHPDPTAEKLWLWWENAYQNKLTIKNEH